MSNDMRIVKFETLIKDVNEKINFVGYGNSFHDYIKNINNYKINNLSLPLIYDYEQMNEYAKVIIKHSHIFLNKWILFHGHGARIKDIRIEASKELIECYRKEYTRKGAYAFIFWAMMVLTVDKTDKEEKLSLICDFAQMLDISDEEMMDILQIIKVVYYEEECYRYKLEMNFYDPNVKYKFELKDGHKFNSNNIVKYFYDLLIWRSKEMKVVQ